MLPLADLQGTQTTALRSGILPQMKAVELLLSVATKTVSGATLVEPDTVLATNRLASTTTTFSLPCPFCTALRGAAIINQGCMPIIKIKP